MATIVAPVLTHPFEEQRQYFRAVTKSGERVSLAERRRRFQERWAAVTAELAAA